MTIVVSRAVPKLLYSVRTRRILRGWTIWESMSAPYSKLPGEKVSTPSTESWIGPNSRQAKAMYERIKAVSTWRMPWVTLPKALGGEGLGGSHLVSRGKALIFRSAPVFANYLLSHLQLLSFCQLVAAALYAAAVWVCVTKDAELKSNPNRFGSSRFFSFHTRVWSLMFWTDPRLHRARTTHPSLPSHYQEQPAFFPYRFVIVSPSRSRSRTMPDSDYYQLWVTRSSIGATAGSGASSGSARLVTARCGSISTQTPLTTSSRVLKPSVVSLHTYFSL